MGIIYLVWCSAVSLGRKPVPGGVTKVFLGLERIFPLKSTMPELFVKYLLLLCWRCLRFRVHIWFHYLPCFLFNQY